MKKVIKKIISPILLCTVLAGCSDNTTLPNSDSKLYDGFISPLRMGTDRLGIVSFGNGFECTETGSYFMCKIGADSWLLYADHGSDTIIKLCGRPDCNHTGEDCNAYFDSSTGICYYDGFLYTFDIRNGDIIRLNLDGTGRTTIYNITSFEKENQYTGRQDQKIINGIFMESVLKIDKNGETIDETCYYKVDGSMKEPKIDTFCELFMNTDGESFVGMVDYDSNSDLYTYGIWEPEKGVVAELFKADDIRSRGYIGIKAEYYIEDGVIIENSYTEGKKELINTGLKGNYQLVCFPDCMVVYEYNPNISEITLEEVTFHFYGWDCSDLGSVKINYEFNSQMLGAGLICGETSKCVILTDSVHCVPRYYINKSDLGTGNIEIHPFKLPEGMQSEFMEGDKHEENN